MKTIDKTKQYLEEYVNIKAYVDSIKDSNMLLDEEDIKLIILCEHITKAIASYERDMIDKDTLYLYQAFKLYYIDKLPYTRVRMVLATGKNTPKKWIDKAIEYINIKLFGYMAIEDLEV